MSHLVELDCYQRALPDEPKFTLLGRDPMFAHFIREWADHREREIKCGVRPKDDIAQVINARIIACEGEEWRRRNDGKWRDDAQNGDAEHAEQSGDGRVAERNETANSS